MWYQKEITLNAKKRGFHLVTDEILRQLPELKLVQIGLLNVFIKHTSASLTINENANPTVRQDFESYFNRVVPEIVLPTHAHCLDNNFTYSVFLRIFWYFCVGKIII